MTMTQPHCAHARTVPSRTFPPLPVRRALLMIAVAAFALVLSRLTPGVGAEEGKGPTVLVAPLAMHGTGRGTFGDGATNPPFFLSEAEARELIVEEFEHAAITMNADGLTLPEVAIPITVQTAGGETRTQPAPLVLDGISDNRKIAYEFISEADYLTWRDKDSGFVFSGTDDFLGAATILRDGVEKAKPAAAVAVFYDPCVGRKDVWENAKNLPTDAKAIQEQAKLIARYEIRQQVRDYLTWLKVQGVR